MKDDIQSKVENYLDQEYALILERHEDGEKPYYSYNSGLDYNSSS